MDAVRCPLARARKESVQPCPFWPHSGPFRPQSAPSWLLSGPTVAPNCPVAARPSSTACWRPVNNVTAARCIIDSPLLLWDAALPSARTNGAKRSQMRPFSTSHTHPNHPPQTGEGVPPSTIREGHAEGAGGGLGAGGESSAPPPASENRTGEEDCPSYDA